MKNLTIVLFVSVHILSLAQSSNLSDKLAEYNLQLVNKISIGSSPDEVKRILGKPAAVEPGFPESDEMLFFDEIPSDQVGQLNYTTWFYRLTKKKITYTVYTDTSYFINGVKVFSTSYNYYLDKDSIYYQPICLINGEVVSIDRYKSYLDKDSVYLNIFGEIDSAPVIEQLSKQDSISHDATLKIKPKSSPITRNKGKRGFFVKKESQEMKLDKMILSTTDIMMYKRDYVLMKKESQEMKIVKQHKASDTFLPILCIVFEKGTNVVATVKVYFQLL